MSSGAALAQVPFLEVVETYSFLEGPYSNASPHAGPVRLNFTGPENIYQPSVATGIVEFANAPAPYVYASVTGVGVTPVLDATLKYSFDVSGPASSYVPLTFTANFNLGHGSFGNRTSIDFRVNGSGVDYLTGGSEFVQGSVLCQWVGIGQCDGSTYPGEYLSSVSVNIAGSSTSLGGSAYGTITGTFMAPTDAAGRGIGYVSMNAFASGGYGPESWAFIDPRFEIAPTYLALNPTAAFELLPGMGSDLAMMPVPVPGSSLAAERRHAGLADSGAAP
jgi:hypothetical protein